jgi:hypothetical protein
LLALAAFGAAFVVVRWLVVPALAPTETSEPVPTPSAVVVPGGAFSAAPKLAFPVEIRTESLAQGTDPGAGKGLIDVSAAANDALYVDGTFVGRGPRRLVPVPVGRHEVRILRGETPRNVTVEVAAGQSTRVDATPLAEARPSP